jgi:predicted nucleotidyltransferase
VLTTQAAIILVELRQGIEAALSPTVIGIYLFGSYVLGHFDVQLSDVDLLVVTDGGATDRQLAELETMHANLVNRHPEWDDRVEVLYADVETLRAFRLGGTVIRISPGEPIHRTEFLPHWLVDLYTVQEHGVALEGPDAVDVLPPITVDEFRGCISRTVLDWQEWMVGTREERFLAYVRLALCRSLYAYRFGRQSSKVSAARWVTQEYPQWANLADEAISWREDNSSRHNAGALARTEEFGRFALAQTRL